MKNKYGFFRPLFCAVLALCALFSLFPLSASGEAAPPKITEATSAAVCNVSRGQTLYSLNRELPVFPAATVKVMTAIVAIEHYGDDLSHPVLITQDVVDKAEGVTVGFKSGETIAAEDLIGALVVGNANDAALALAKDVAGSTKAFVEMMNEKAKLLGMTSTNYENPTGLHDDDMLTTAGDTVLLASYAAHNAKFVSLCGLSYYTVPQNYHSAERIVNNRNYLVSPRIVSDYYDESVTGMNYGSTYEAGGCLIASATYNGEVFVSVVFGARSDTRVIREEHEEKDEDGKTVVVPAVTGTVLYAFEECKKLLDWARQSFSYVTVVSPSVPLLDLPVSLGKGVDRVPVFSSEALELYLPSDIDLESDLRRETVLDQKTLTAPVSEGQKVGVMKIYYGDEQVGALTLVTRSAVGRSFFDACMSRVKEISSHPSFMKILLLVLALLVIGILLSSVIRYRQKKEAIERHRREKEEKERLAEKHRTEQITRIP